MREVNLLDRYPRSRRPIAERCTASGTQREIARRFGREYFDGERTQGYGGYRYDGRWRPIAERFRDYYCLEAGQRVLEVGCAKGFLLHDLRVIVPGLDVVGLDISTYALQHAMAGVKSALVRGSADRLPFAARSFDLVISINTAHNLAPDRCRESIRELERVSRGGKYVQVDSYLNATQRVAFERWQLCALTHFDPRGWESLFVEAGYTGDYYWTITE